MILFSPSSPLTSQIGGRRESGGSLWSQSVAEITGRQLWDELEDRWIAETLLQVRNGARRDFYLITKCRSDKRYCIKKQMI